MTDISEATIEELEALKARAEARIAELKADDPEAREAWASIRDACHYLGWAQNIRDNKLCPDDRNAIRKMREIMDKAFAAGVASVKPAEPEWTPWGPDSPGYPKCPVPDGAKYEALRRDGEKLHGVPARLWMWEHSRTLRPSKHITAYRVWS